MEGPPARITTILTPTSLVIRHLVDPIELANHHEVPCRIMLLRLHMKIQVARFSVRPERHPARMKRFLSKAMREMLLQARRAVDLDLDDIDDIPELVTRAHALRVVSGSAHLTTANHAFDHRGFHL